MRSLGLNRGDVISIKGGRNTAAIVDRAYPADIGEGIVRIDGLIRKNFLKPFSLTRGFAVI